MRYWSSKARSIVNANSSLAPAAKLQGVRLSETGDRDTSDGAPRVTEKTGRRKGGAVTIHEVARHASVSPMTVSRVINGESNVRDTTRELVMEAVRALNYRPNPAARVLAGARDTRIALISSNPSAS